MNCVERDDIESLRKRKQGETIVAVQFVSLNPIKIRDESGEMSFGALPPNESSLLLLDYCLLLFECFADKPPQVRRTTPVPEDVYKLYLFILSEYRKGDRTSALTQAAPTLVHQASGFQF